MMVHLRQLVLLTVVFTLLIKSHDATAPFISAITSALATIPLSGPLTTGLVGAKLALGTKLLFFLGYFGRSQPKVRPAKKQRTQQPKQISNAGRLPLPYAVGGEFPSRVSGAGAGGFGQSVGGSGFPQGGFGQSSGGSGFSQMSVGGGGFGQETGGSGYPVGGGFGLSAGGGGFSPEGPYGGFDPAELYQALAAQGLDPVTAMQAMNMGSRGLGFGNVQNSPSFGSGSSISHSQPGGAGNPAGNVVQFPYSGGFGPIPQAGGYGNMPYDDSNSLPPSPERDVGPKGGDDENDVESFFTFLRDMDDNTCISRLMCDIGADPSFLGDFSENIYGIISSLDVMPSSGAYQYIAVMETGRREGGCGMRFPQCTDSAYEIVKNIAPTVGVPDNINSEMINKL